MKYTAILLLLIFLSGILLANNNKIIFRYSGNVSKTSNDLGRSWRVLENPQNYKFIKNGIVKVTSDKGQTWDIIYKEKRFVKFITIGGKEKISYDGGKSWQILENTVSNERLNLVIYPNPLKDKQLNISFHTQEIIKGTINIYNLTGNQIFNTFITTVEGKNNINLDLNDIKTGSYKIVVCLQGNILTNDLILIR